MQDCCVSQVILGKKRDGHSFISRRTTSSDSRFGVKREERQSLLGKKVRGSDSKREEKGMLNNGSMISGNKNAIFISRREFKNAILILKDDLISSLFSRFASRRTTA